MVAIPIKVEVEEKKAHGWRNGHWTTVHYSHPTMRAFVMLWQLSETVDDVKEALDAADCSVFHRNYENTRYTLNGLKAKATNIRKNYKIELRRLKTRKQLETIEQKRTDEEEEIKFLRELARVLAKK